MVGRSKGMVSSSTLSGSRSLIYCTAGCRTCVRRKVACDEGRPGCKRCKKAHKHCEGYVRAHRFVDEVARTVRHAQKRTHKSPAEIRSRDAIHFAYNVQTLPDLDFAGFQDNALIAFLLSRIFDGKHDVWNPWMQTQAEDTSSLTAQNSIHALSKVYFGRMHHQRDISCQGLVLYGAALKNLNQDLRNKDTAWSISTLRSAMTLQLYEV